MVYNAGFILLSCPVTSFTLSILRSSSALEEDEAEINISKRGEGAPARKEPVYARFQIF